MSAIIYLITNTVNGKQYVGQTIVGLERRWKRHCWNAQHDSPCYIHRAIYKYGIEAFTYEILEESTPDKLNDLERYWIHKLTPAYNMTAGGYGSNGRIVTEDTRKKISAAHSGEKHPMYGKSHSAEAKSKMSMAKTKDKHPMWGKPRSEETKAKLRDKNLGKTLTVEHRAKLSEAAKQKVGNRNPMFGKSHTIETRAKISVTKKLRQRMNRISAPAITINTQQSLTEYEKN